MAETDPLSKMILQPASENAQIDINDASYVERWKGPWDSIKLLTSTNRVMGTTLIVGQKRPNFNNGNWEKTNTPPDALNSAKPWVIVGLQIQQEASGDNGYLTINYQQIVPTVDSTGQDSGQLPQKKEDTWSEEQTEARAWSLTWGTYERSVLAYSQDKQGQILYAKQPAAVFGDNAYWTDKTQGTAGVSYLPDGKEMQIAKFYARDLKPQFHYPIVTYHQEWDIIAGQPAPVNDIGNGIDKKTALPNDCPFKFGNEWQWLKIGDQGSVVQTDSWKVESGSGPTPTETVEMHDKYVREQQWMGGKEILDEFYGENAWEPVDDSNDGE